jgi:signal transduction histidine kinase
LRNLLKNRPDLLGRLNDVTAAAHFWRVSVAEPAIAKTKSEGVKVSTSAQIDEGKRSFDAIRAALTRLMAPLQVSRNAASVDLINSLSLLRMLLLMSLGLLIVLGVLTWVALRRWVTNPLARFGAEVVTVESGEISHAVSMEDAPAEIRLLAEQVERMRLRIVQEFAMAEQARDDAQRARAVVEEQAQDLARSNTELEQFAYVASHDLQEPLRMVSSYMGLLKRRYQGRLDADADEFIGFAVDGVTRMQALINDLLSYSRAGREPTPSEPTDSAAALAKALRNLKSAIEEKGALISAGPLPQVMADPLQVSQLFQNLIANGIKFCRDRRPEISVGAERHGAEWTFFVRDNGIGIDPQYADRIFLIFQRLHKREEFAGTGIGLAICKKIVERHGGRIWLESTPGQGTTFYFTFQTAGGQQVAA